MENNYIENVAYIDSDKAKIPVPPSTEDVDLGVSEDELNTADISAEGEAVNPENGASASIASILGENIYDEEYLNRLNSVTDEMISASVAAAFPTPEDKYGFTYRPTVDRRDAKIVFSALLLTAALLVAAYFFASQFKGIIGICALIVIALAIFVVVRYILPEYSYVLMMDNSGSYRFVVTKRVGKRVETLATVMAAHIHSIARARSEMDKKHAYGEQKFNLCPSLVPKDTYVMKIKSRRERLIFLVEINDEVADTLMQCASYMRAREVEED